MAMNGTTNYGTTPTYGASPYPGQTAAAPAAVPADLQSLNASVDMQLKSAMTRGAVPASMPQSFSTAPTTPATPSQPAAPTNDTSTDPAQQGNISWALLMEMKQASGQALSSAEQARYQSIMSRANGGGASQAPAGAPSSASTDPAQQGNISWALLMEMKQASGQQLSAAEQARYQAIMARANQAQPGAGGAGGTTPSQPTTDAVTPTTPAPSQPDATPAAQPMTQAEYDTEVKWALTFEKSDEAKRYNAFNKEKKIRAGQAEGTPAMTDQQFATEAAWAQQFAQLPDVQRYKKIAAEVKRRQASGERTRPTGLLDKVKNFFTGLIGKFTKKKTEQPAAQPSQSTQQPAQQPAQSTQFPPSGQQAPAPRGA